MNDIKVSIIVPIHGVEKYLRRCLNSLLNQKFDFSYEVLCLSDAPNDNSPSIIDEFVELRPDIFKRIDVNNRNVSYTRNDGLKIAKGEYIAFVDGDDFVSEDYIAYFYKVAIEKDADIVITNFYMFKKEKRKKFILSFIPYRGYISRRKATQLISNDIFIRGYLWYKFFKKDVIKNCKFIDVKKTIEDLQFSSMAFVNAKKIYWTQKRNYYYVFHDGSITTKWDACKYVQLIINFLAFLKLYAISIYGEKEGSKFYKFSLFVRRFVFLYYVFISKHSFKDKIKISKIINEELRIIRKHITYTNSPWEDVIKEAGLDKLKEDIIFEKSKYINLIDYVYKKKD